MKCQSPGGCCPLPDAGNGYCKKHQDFATEPLPTKPAYQIPKVSYKRQAQLNVYHNETKADHLRKHPTCEICPKILAYKEAGGQAKWWPVCGKTAVETHHVEGRENELLNKSPLLSSCDSKKFLNNGHAWLAVHPREAELIEIVISRHKIKR